MFGFGGLFANSVTASGLAALYPFTVSEQIFIQHDIKNTFRSILIDTFEKSAGLPEKYEHILWDSCVQSSANKGLITLLVDAMYNKSKLFLVYVNDVLREADSTEKRKIEDEYKKNGESKTGIYISFEHYTKTDMLRIYSIFEYCLLHSLHKQMNLSRAVQVKIKGIRSNVGAGDAEVAIQQAQIIAEALRNGQEIMLDKEDAIECATVDTSATEKGIEFLAEKKAYLLGLPASYISGKQTGGIGSTGEADMRAIEKGLKQFFFSIIRPVIKDLLNVQLTFRSEDFRFMGASMEALKTFEITEAQYLSTKTKRSIISRLFNLDEKEENKRIEAEEIELKKLNDEFEKKMKLQSQTEEEDEQE